MNKWVQKSIDFTNAPGYLDRLTEIYPAIPTQRPPLPQSVKDKIEELIITNNSLEAIKLLVNLKGYPFPLEHPYVPLLRAYPKLLEQNPNVVEQIGQILVSLGPAGAIEGCERPPDLNRQMGQRFKNWLRRHFTPRGYKFLPEHVFSNYQGKAFLDAGDTAITKYANKNLGCQITRGRDFLFRVKDKFVIGEARFLSDSGGSQRRDVRETIDFAKDVMGNIIKIAVLDGAPWFDNSMLSVIQSLEDDEPALSALLLEDFLESLR
ncbi:MAG: hypothetical protein KAV68_00140 [Dehalococcoidales bacterium]|nr:hypothetical protein [Dehalococcoidales bacterium]